MVNLLTKGANDESIRYKANREVDFAIGRAGFQFDVLNEQAKKSAKPLASAESVKSDLENFRTRIDEVPSGDEEEDQINSILKEMSEYEANYKAELNQKQSDMIDKDFKDTKLYKDTFETPEIIAATTK